MDDGQFSVPALRLSAQPTTVSDSTQISAHDPAVHRFSRSRSRVSVEIAASLVAVLSAQALRSISFSEDQREKASPYCAGPGLTRVSVWCCYATHAPLQLPTAANHRAGNTEEVPARIRDTITTRSHRRRQDECFRSDTTRGRDLTFTSSRVGAYVRTTVRPF